MIIFSQGQEYRDPTVSESGLVKGLMAACGVRENKGSVSRSLSEGQGTRGKSLADMLGEREFL